MTPKLTKEQRHQALAEKHPFDLCVADAQIIAVLLGAARNVQSDVISQGILDRISRDLYDFIDAHHPDD